MNKTELERLASMGHALRPDWPVRSLLTYLSSEHSARAYTDVAVALAIIATDPITQTPRRMSEAGPWWTATPPTHTTSTVARQGAARCPLHEHELAGNCRVCRAEWLVEGVWPAGTEHVDAHRFAQPGPADRAAGEGW